jgi:hypothetical protein
MKNGNHNNTVFFRNKKDLVGKTPKKSTPNCLVNDRILAGRSEYALKSGVCRKKKF